MRTRGAMMMMMVMCCCAPLAACESLRGKEAVAVTRAARLGLLLDDIEREGFTPERQAELRVRTDRILTLIEDAAARDAMIAARDAAIEWFVSPDPPSRRKGVEIMLDAWEAWVEQGGTADERG